MVVGILRIELLLQDNRSLKGKRKVVKSMIDKVKHRFNVAIAEVGHQNRRGSTVLGIVTVGNDAGYLHGLLEKSVAWIERERPDAPLIDYSIEIVR